MNLSHELEIFCVTNKRLKYLENFQYNLAGVGLDKFPKNYIKSNEKKNIFFKEKYYSELTFHYWFWKNKLNKNENKWIGFCQKRRFWINKDSNNENISIKNFSEILLTEPQREWTNYNSIICEPIFVNKIKKMTLIKKGFFKILKKPSLLFNNNKQSVKLHFDLHHGSGYLDKAINVLNDKDKKDFYNYVTTRSYYNPHIMFISKPEIIDKWFNTLFPWLERCEKIFGFKELKGYEKRIYAYLAERYLSFWFKKYTKYIEWPWAVYENKDE